jgi:hypothetical protein
MRELALPSWAKMIGKGKVEIEATEFYPTLLAELGVADADIDQYWLEVAYQCAKLDIQQAVFGTTDGPEKGGALVTIVTDASKGEDGSKWAQRKWPEGAGASAATKGRAALEHYKELRGGFF